MIQYIKSFQYNLELKPFFFLSDYKEYELAAKIASASNDTGRPLRHRSVQSYKEEELSDEDEYLCKLMLERNGPFVKLALGQNFCMERLELQSAQCVECNKVSV